MRTLARRLRQAGAGRGSLIGVCLERSAEMVTAMPAVLKAGAGFVPLDPRAPTARTEGIAQDAGLVLVLTETGLLERLTVPRRGVGREEAPPPATPAEAGTALGDVAYVYYTSGSTGTPKGVAIDHRCAPGRLRWLTDRYGLRPGQRVVHKTPLIFDVAIWELSPS
ncbi:AMP-binding protein [Streptomyces sp. NPDC002935]|uniref:AMP-binding protein n=1 Tax=Streptomyces sp. NPDC002935 TaxID=3154545 RepID=UPI0033A5CB8D